MSVFGEVFGAASSSDVWNGVFGVIDDGDSIQPISGELISELITDDLIGDLIS